MASQPELSVRALRALPLAVQRRTMLLWLRSHSVADISFSVVESAVKLLYHDAPARVNLTQDRWIRRRQGTIFIQPSP